LTTLLFADDQVILTASQNCLQKSLYQLYDVASKYNMIISTTKTKILPRRRKELIRAKIIDNNNIAEQVRNFNYLRCQLGSNRYLVIRINYKVLTICAEQLNIHRSIKPYRKQY
jgi:uncharacterized protein with PIN domain